MGITTFISLLITTQTSYAVYGEYIDDSELIPQSCRIVFESVTRKETPLNHLKKPIGTPVVHKDKDQTFCSATLIGPHELLSAAHCSWSTFNRFEGGTRANKDGTFTQVKIDHGIHVKAICHGYGGIEEEHRLDWRNTWFHPYYDNKGVPMLDIENDEPGLQKIFQPYFDVAIFKSDEAFKIKPMKFARSGAEVEKLRKLSESNPDNCRVYGYGLNNRGDNTAGVLHGIRAYHLINRWNELAFRSSFNAVASGDSGGTLACRDEHHEEIVVGINSETTVSNGPLQFYFEPPNFKDSSLFTSLGFGSVQRWIQYVLNEIPLDNKHTGRSYDKNFDIKKYKQLLAYEIPFVLNHEMPAILNELKTCAELDKTHSHIVNKNMVKGYRQTLETALPAIGCGKTQYEDWKSGRKMIRGCQVRIEFDPKFDPQIASRVGLRTLKWNDTYWEDPRENFRLPYVKYALDPAKELIYTELRACHIKGLGFDGERRFPLPQNREIMLDWWMNH